MALRKQIRIYTLHNKRKAIHVSLDKKAIEKIENLMDHLKLELHIIPRNSLRNIEIYCDLNSSGNMPSNGTAWKRPISRIYTYNLNVGENYYTPMTTYLDNKAGLETPGALSFR